MPHAYASRPAAIAALTDLLGDAPSDRALTLLDTTAGTLDDAPVYRPHVTAALVMASARNTTRLHSADGAQFDTPASTISALLNEQALWDAGVSVPDAWRVALIRANVMNVAPASRFARLTTTF